MVRANPILESGSIFAFISLYTRPVGFAKFSLVQQNHSGKHKMLWCLAGHTPIGSFDFN